MSKYKKNGDIQYAHLDSTVFHGHFMDNFQSYRNLKCMVTLYPETGKNLLKVYNPYDFVIPLDKLKYSVAYSNKHKQVQELIPLRVKPEKTYMQFLEPKDTASFVFELPLPEAEDIGYFRIGISESRLLPGLNGKPIRIEQ